MTNRLPVHLLVFLLGLGAGVLWYWLIHPVRLVVAPEREYREGPRAGMVGGCEWLRLAPFYLDGGEGWASV